MSAKSRTRPISPVRTFAPLAAFLLGTLSLANRAEANDYTIALAVDVEGKRATAKLENCVFRQSCQHRFEELKLTVGIILQRRDDKDSGLYLHAQDGCCYFAGGERSVRFDARTSMHSYPISEGRERRRNEFVQNRRVGTLYMALSINARP